MEGCKCKECDCKTTYSKEIHKAKINGKDVPIIITDAYKCPSCKSTNNKGE